MALCLYCDESTDDFFCDEKCRTEYSKGKGVVVIGKNEREKRQRLFDAAAEGCREAVEEIKREYKVTTLILQGVQIF
ncbi:MAG: hypothetical protein KAR06_03045 [Deltaproteobacteria bacterium]|nr:hypothetical protein [Deltaproteobacteria bacterium]